jgi:hypothetical protein
MITTHATRGSGSEDHARLYAVIEELAGPTDAAGDRAAAVLHAHVAVLAWVRDTLGEYPVPDAVAAAISAAAQQLRADNSDPVDVLTRVALDAVTVYRATVAA